MNKLKGQTVLVTGGAGFIGSHLVALLLKEQCRVRVLDNLRNGKWENIKQHQQNKNFKFIRGDITKGVDLKKAIKGVDVVFHLACLGVRHSLRNPLENHKVNAYGTLLVLEASRREKIKRFVYCSSSEVYGTAQYVPMDEAHPTFPCTVYGASKLAGEAYTRAYFQAFGLKTVIIRPFNSYGPRSHYEGDAGEVIPKSIVRALNDHPILVFGDGTQTRDFTYVKDTALGIMKAAINDRVIGQTFNLGSRFEISVNQLRDMILKLTGSNVKCKYLPRRPGDVLRLYADSTAYFKKTRWQPKTSFKDGLTKTIEWFNSNPKGLAELLKKEVAVNWK